MNTFLTSIIQEKRRSVEAAKQLRPMKAVVASAIETRSLEVPHSFHAALATGRTNIIAEIKRASPSKGDINVNVDVSELARLYERGGACAISVLTEETFFKGSLDDLAGACAAVSIPILRKDFIIDEFQIYEAAAAGADAILLIVAALGVDELVRFQSIARGELGMDVLVETHTREEMGIAQDAGATLIGVNNRDLHTFEVSLDVSRDLINYAPPGAKLIAESGLRTSSDLAELGKLGYAGFLIGELLMLAHDPESALGKLITETQAVEMSGQV